MILLELFSIVWIVLIADESLAIDVLNARFLPNGAAFFTDIGSTKEISIYMQDFASTGNVDDVSLNINVGNLRVNASINPDANSSPNQPLTTVHLFQKELWEDDPTLHFLCHSLITPEFLKSVNNRHMSSCCIIKVIASNRHFFTGCLIDNFSLNNRSTCHASIHIENRAWNDSLNNELDVSYRINTVQYVKSNTVNLLMDSAALSRQCWTPLATQMSIFKFLSKISLKKVQRDEIREIGRNIRLDIPARRLKNGEYFNVPVRVKRHTNIADFTLRCEIPLNTYVEFVRVVWPWETDESSSNSRDANVRFLKLNNGFSAWDISQRHIPSLKGNVTEVVARYRETAIDPIPSDHFRDDPIIYKLLFRVVPPPKDSSGRIGPRFLWSLISLSRRNTADQSASGSPIVTRLNIESFEFKHLALVIKSTSLVNTAVLSGYPIRRPVWVYGLTHGNEVRDVTSTSTCHTSDDSVAHFPKDSCSAGLVFSGGELGGADTLSLVAKVDRTSADESITVWYPQEPQGVTLVVESPRGGPTAIPFAPTESLTSGYSASSILLRALADSQSITARSTNPQSPSPTTYFQQARLRVFARFSTANNRNPSMGAYSHTSMDEVSTSLALDVTDLTAHCLRLEYVNETVSSLHPDDISNAPARLVLVGESSVPDDSGRVQTATRVWVVGQRAGRVRVKLSPVADSPLVKAALPTSLAKMRKQQHQQNQGKQNGWDAQQFQALWVTVTDNDAVWPVGITAQLVTDLTVTITQQERSESKYSTTPFYHQSNDIERVESSFKFYTTHIRFSGSRVGRSKGFPMISNSGAAPDAFAFQGGDQFPDLSRAKRQLATKTLPRQGLLVVTVQFSDGSVLPWHRIMEVVWELRQQEAPFTLAVENLRPDLVRVDMPPMPTSSPSPTPAQSRHKRSSIAADPQLFGYHGDATTAPVSEAKNKTDPPPSRPEWFGPTVFLLREDESFIGDLLRVNLHSRFDNSLLFSAPVHARIEAARPSRPREDDVSSPDISVSPSIEEPLPLSSQWEAGRKTSPTHIAIETSRSQLHRFWPNPEGLDSSADNTDDDEEETMRRGVGAPTSDQLDPSAENTGSQWKREWNHLPDAFETQQKPPAYDPKIAELFGSPALKDAPGMRSSSPYQRLLYPDSIDKSSLKKNPKDKEIFVDRPNADSGLNEASSKLAEGSVEGKDGADASSSGHRPALELIMYILLGLFILIALIFAVNCGAMVARYRWEHSRGAKENLRLQHLSELAMSNANTDAAGTGECSSTSTADLQFHGDQIDTLDGTKTGTYNRCISAFATFRRKFGLRSLSQQRINRDKDWVWLGRDALAESQLDSVGSNQTGSRLATATTSIDMSKNPSLTRTPLTPTAVPSPAFNNESRLNAVSTPQQQKMPLTGSYHGGNTRLRASQKNMLSTYATCHYEGEECSIRILTNTVEPEKSNLSASRCSIASAINSSQHLHLPIIGHHQQSHLYRNQHSRYSPSNHRNHPNMDQRRRSAFVFGRSLILDHQNSEWQFSSEFSSHHHLQSQRCYCNRGLASPWRYRGDHQQDSNRTADNDPDAILSMLNVEGYQTLPSQMPAWQDGSTYGSPPCPPLRTSSKLRPPMLMSYYNDQNRSSGSVRPTSFPNKNSYQQDPLLTTSVTNEIYSLLADNEDDATLTRQPSSRPYCPVRPNVTNQAATSNKSTITDLPRRTRSYSRIYNTDKTVIATVNNMTTTTPGSRRCSTRGPLEPQSISGGNYHHRSIYANCVPLPVPTTPSDVRSTMPDSIS